MNNSVELINTAMMLVESGEIKSAKILLESITESKAGRDTPYKDGRKIPAYNIFINEINDVFSRLDRGDIEPKQAEWLLNSSYKHAEQTYHETGKDSSIPSYQKITYDQLQNIARLIKSKPVKTNK